MLSRRESGIFAGMKEYTPDQAAAKLGISLATVYRLIDTGRLSATGAGYGRRITSLTLKPCFTRNCPTCGKPFQAGHGRQAYCSNLCRYAAGNKRKVDRRKAQSPAKKPHLKIDLGNPRLAAALKHVKKKTGQS